MSKKKKVIELKAGDLFRVVGPRGVGPAVWIWEGQLEGSQGFRVRRLMDNFSITLNAKDLVVPLEEIEPPCADPI